MAHAKQNINIDNRKSRFNYEYLETFTAGIKLLGTEVKSVLDSEVSIDEAFCIVTDSGIIIRNMYIKPYEFARIDSHEPLRDRVLLLTKSELNGLKRALINRGLTVIPTKLFTNKNGLFKLQIALSRGKKMYDKKESIKEKDITRQLKRDENS